LAVVVQHINQATMSWEALNKQLRRLVLRFLAADNYVVF